ncbi:MAG: glycosyltransferase family 2 protein [Clostridia bacterium]|nr:glycosyltransferase family 2 protein [Clostridia bacterium]
MKLLLIIPAYNEQENIERVIDVLKRDCPQYDYLIVNDGSRDKTEEICIKRGFHFVSHPVNLGLAAAVQTGMLFAYKNGYDAAIQFDGDGQHDPDYVEKMANEIEKGYNIVIGSRFVDKKKPKSLRMFGSNLIQLAIKITTGKTLKDPTSGMRMFDKAMIKKLAFAVDLGPEPDTVALLVRGGATFSEIQVEMHDRTAGESYLNFANSVNYMIRMFVSILILQWFRKG